MKFSIYLNRRVRNDIKGTDLNLIDFMSFCTRAGAFVGSRLLLWTLQKRVYSQKDVFQSLTFKSRTLLEGDKTILKELPSRKIYSFICGFFSNSYSEGLGVQEIKQDVTRIVSLLKQKLREI